MIQPPLRGTRPSERSRRPPEKRKPSAAAPADRIPALDGMRGLALICIVAYHTVIMCSPQHVAWYWLVQWGPATLDIFFVLSGYLITGILLRSRGGPAYYSRFLLRRALRIFPAYYLVLLLVFGLLPFISHDFRVSGTAADLPWYLFYLQNVKISLEGLPAWPFAGHLWSMAVEEQFYLTWPFVVAMLSRAALQRLCLVLLVAGMSAKWYLTVIADAQLMAHTATFSRMGAIAAGCWVACLDRNWLAAQLRHPAAWLNATLFVFAWVLVLRLVPAGGVEYALATLTASLAPAVPIALIHAGRLPEYARQFICLPLLLWLGKLSYGMYLLHFPVAGLLFEFHEEWLAAGIASVPNFTALVFTLATFFTTAGLAVLMYRLVELPALQLKERIRYNIPEARIPA